MDDTQQDPQQDPTPDPDPTPEPPAEGDSGRYAVYDETLTQYVGSVHEKKGAASEEAKELRKLRRHKGHKLAVRQV